MPGAAVASAVDNHLAIFPCSFSPSLKKPKQSWVNRCEFESLKNSFSLPFFSELYSLFSQEGKLVQFRLFFLTVICAPSLCSPSALCVVAGLRSSVTVNYDTLETDEQQELGNRERMHGRV